MNRTIVEYVTAHAMDSYRVRGAMRVQIEAFQPVRMVEVECSRDGIADRASLARAFRALADDLEKNIVSANHV
jgi:hypothetical protein